MGVGRGLLLELSENLHHLIASEFNPPGGRDAFQGVSEELFSVLFEPKSRHDDKLMVVVVVDMAVVLGCDG